MSIFKFKYFDLKQNDSPMKVGTDAMLLGAFSDVDLKTKGLDVGSGTGVLSLMCAQRNSNLLITAIEIDELACKEAKENFQSSSFADQLSIINSDFLQFDTADQFDFIISNPPYYQSRLENIDKRKSNARHEISLPKAKFVNKVADYLTEDGEFWFIVPFEDSKGWEHELSHAGLFLNQRIDVYGKEGGPFVRSICRASRIQSKVVVDEFTIRKSDFSYTEEYIELTKEFHFKSLK
ncbi:MAG: methyltransferase [Crocinitomicaceae bacterium]|nr:methyltransferase [Crocinitomicaceae bacterium]